MRILIACEFSGIVREAFKRKGHDAWSCDLLPTEIPGNHIHDDVLNWLDDGWDMMIAHPPCTYLCVSGLRWLDDPRYPNRRNDQADAIKFVEKLWYSSIDKIAIENPIGILSSQSKLGKPTQIIQPYYFGDEAQKTTCLWLKNLPKLRYGTEVQMAFGEEAPPQNNIVSPGEMYITKSGKVLPRWYAELASAPHDIRGKLRSVTFKGIAEAMAEQWGNLT